MTSTLDDALAYLFQNESTVYTDRPLDSGGPTKFGVTLKAYAAFLGREVTPAEIKDLTEDHVRIFYLSRYWQPLACDRLTDPALAIALFDTGVLYGVGTAAVLAQRTLCWFGVSLKLDGLIGDKTLDVFNLVNRVDFIRVFRAFILKRVDSIIEEDPKNECFRKGWQHRADRLLTLGTYAPFNREVT